MKKTFFKKKNCRLCKSDNLLNVMKYEKSPLCDEYLTKPRKQKFYDLNLMMCKRCKFIQIDVVIDPEIIYKNYIYETLSSITLQKHFKKYCQNVLSFYNKKNKVKKNNKQLIVDIGSNDGTLLSFFKDKKCKVLGIEPAKLIAKNANQNGIETICSFFSNSLSNKIIKKYNKANIIMINNLFANIDKLDDFCLGLKNLLAPNGVLIIESSYLLDMIRNNVFDFVYHEHLSYLSILPLREYFINFNLKLIKVQAIETKGGSLRYYFVHVNSNYSNDFKLKTFIKKEQNYNISKYLFKNFENKILKIKKELFNLLSKSNNVNIYGYGASATTTTLISYFQINNFFDSLIDDNSGKIGTYSPGFHIPVYSVNNLLTNNPKVIVILAWRYQKNIIKKLKSLKIKNTKIIIPLPYIKVINL